MSGNNGITTQDASQRTIEVRWSALHSRWQVATDDVPTEQFPYTRAEFVIRLTLLDGERGMIDAWIATDSARRMIRESVSVRCARAQRDDLLHIDAFPSANTAARPLLRVTFQRTNDLLFAQSSLLAEAGWLGGTYDPPTGRCRDRAHEQPSEREVGHIAKR